MQLLFLMFIYVITVIECFGNELIPTTSSFEQFRLLICWNN